MKTPNSLMHFSLMLTFLFSTASCDQQSEVENERVEPIEIETIDLAANPSDETVEQEVIKIHKPSIEQIAAPLVTETQPPERISFVAYEWSSNLSTVSEASSNIVGVPKLYWRSKGLGLGCNYATPASVIDGSAWLGSSYRFMGTSKMKPGRHALSFGNIHYSSVQKSDGSCQIFMKDGEAQSLGVTPVYFGTQVATRYPDVWADYWAKDAKTRIDSWMNEYKSLGGELDVFVLDVEEPMGWYYLTYQAKNGICSKHFTQVGNEAYDCRPWKQIAADTRWPKLKALLNARAVSLGFGKIFDDGDPSYLNDLDTFPAWGLNGSKRFVWDDVMLMRMGSLLEESIYQPIRKYYPNVKFSNYDHGFRNGGDAATLAGTKPWNAFWSGSASNFKNSPVGTGAWDAIIPFDGGNYRFTFKGYVGSHQTRDFYGDINANTYQTTYRNADDATFNLTSTYECNGASYCVHLVHPAAPKLTHTWQLNGLILSPTQKFNALSRPRLVSPKSPGYLREDHFSKSDLPFTALIKEHRFLRAMVMASTAPIIPWISMKDYGVETAIPGVGSFNLYAASPWEYSNMYQENIFHIALTAKIDEFFWWNSGTRKTANDPIVRDCLSTLDTLVGYKDRIPLQTKLGKLWQLDWSDKFMVSGMIANGREIYRFTPKRAPKIVEKSTATFKGDFDGNPLTPDETVMPVIGGNVIGVEGGACAQDAGFWIEKKVL